MTGRCTWCGVVRPLGALIEVSDRRKPWHRWTVCRPSIQGKGEGECFRHAVGPASVHRIRPAIAARLERCEAV